MKRRRIGFLVLVSLLTLEAASVPATAQPQNFTCQVYGGSFVLDDDDFKALANSGISKANFASLEPKRRAQVCDSRKIWRLLKAGEVICDLYERQGHSQRYPNWLPELFGPSEQDKLIDAELAATGKECGR
jgi:hypothetical protein